ncbi:MAG: hypothetical protein ACJ8CR_32205 [Roseiflexaceae bacterium]
MAGQQQQIQKRSVSANAGPTLLAPRDHDADPAPLFITLAQVALAIAQRRVHQRSDTIGPEHAPSESK